MRLLFLALSGWEQIMEAYVKQYGITKVKWMVESADSAQASINAALIELEKHCSEDDIVLVHDGNRALISEDIISDSIVTCRTQGNAVAVIPCNEVIVKTNDGEISNEFLNRDNLRRTQTPHAFTLGKMLWAHEEAEKRGIEKTIATCDLMMSLGETIYFSIGSEKNMKITTPVDVEIFQALLDLGKEE